MQTLPLIDVFVQVLRNMKVILTIITVTFAISGYVAYEAYHQEIALRQHAAVINAIANYIGEMQEKKILPKPEEKK